MSSPNALMASYVREGRELCTPLSMLLTPETADTPAGSGEGALVDGGGETQMEWVKKGREGLEGRMLA